MRQYKWLLKVPGEDSAREYLDITSALDNAQLFTDMSGGTCVLTQNHRERTREAWQFDWSFELVPWNSKRP